MKLIFVDVPEDDPEDDIDINDHTLKWCAKGLEPMRDYLRKKGFYLFLVLTFAEVARSDCCLFGSMTWMSKDLSACTLRKGVKFIGKLYVNKVASILVRKEERRLHDEMKKLQAPSGPDHKIYIKAGTYRWNQDCEPALLTYSWHFRWTIWWQSFSKLLFIFAPCSYFPFFNLSLAHLCD